MSRKLRLPRVRGEGEFEMPVSRILPPGGDRLIVVDKDQVLYFSADRWGNIDAWLLPDQIGFVRSQ